MRVSAFHWLVKTCFYVDDCMAGSNTKEEAAELAGQINELLTAGGLHLRKWATNDNSVLIKIPECDKIESIRKIPTDITVCLLGVIWNPATDSFSYKVKGKDYCIDTKRKLLSEISKIFDPLGWISPVIISVKIIIHYYEVQCIHFYQERRLVLLLPPNTYTLS